jgi:hypothetical protein
MTEEQTAIFRDTLLRAAARFKAPLAASTCAVCAKTAGFRVTTEELTDHLEYLVVMKFLEKPHRSHTGQLEQWRITSEGMADLERRGLA